MHCRPTAISLIVLCAHKTKNSNKRLTCRNRGFWINRSPHLFDLLQLISKYMYEIVTSNFIFEGKSWMNFREKILWGSDVKIFCGCGVKEFFVWLGGKEGLKFSHWMLEMYVKLNSIESLSSLGHFYGAKAMPSNNLEQITNLNPKFHKLHLNLKEKIKKIPFLHTINIRQHQKQHHSHRKTCINGKSDTWKSFMHIPLY